MRRFALLLSVFGPLSVVACASIVGLPDVPDLDDGGGDRADSSGKTTGKVDATPGSKSDATTGKSDATTGKSDATTGKSDATTGKSDATTGKSDATTGKTAGTTTGETTATSGKATGTTSETTTGTTTGGETTGMATTGTTTDGTTGTTTTGTTTTGTTTGTTTTAGTTTGTTTTTTGTTTSNCAATSKGGMPLTSDYMAAGTLATNAKGGYAYAFSDMSIGGPSSACIEPSAFCGSGSSGPTNTTSVGSVPAFGYYGGGIAVNLNEAMGVGTKVGTYTPTGSGLTYAITSLPAATRLVIDNAGLDYCYNLTTTSGTVPWAMFNSQCFIAPAPVADALAGPPTATHVEIEVIAGTAVVGWDFCVTQLAIAP